jgi:glycosyltransferase involved in cell wall biosynthesis
MRERTDPVKFGVVTPTLNAERFLERTIRSVEAQVVDGVEVDHVIVDGGSTDRTADIAVASSARFVVNTDDRGMYDAINRGMSLVDGDVVGYINADDEIAHGAFGAIAGEFATHPGSQWVCGRVEYIDADDRVLGRMQPVPLSLDEYVGLGWSCIPQQTVWVRRGFWDRIGRFDTSYRNCGDYEWYARALREAPPLILHRTLGRFRLHPGMLSLDSSKMERESRMIQERYGAVGTAAFVRGKLLSLRLNARNPAWLVAKKTGRISFTSG